MICVNYLLSVLIRRRQLYSSGSASVEFIILMGLLLPIGFGIVMLGKLIDLGHTSEQAGRYAVWQSTVTPALSNSSQTLRIKQRFFSDPSAPIKSATNNQQAGVNHLWGYQAQSQQSRMRTPADIQIDGEDSLLVQYSNNLSVAPIATGLSNKVKYLSSTLGALSADSWKISGNGFVKAELEAGVGSSKWLKGTNSSCRTTDSGACIQAASVILNDGWSAGTVELAKQRVQSFVPSSAFKRVGDAAAILAGSWLFPELKGLSSAFGHVNMNVLPESTRP
ncbi:MAG: pilus assembly protein [Granulosicoccus sp.]|nr:pilus assembly protein [Granulosicoccus sp.]